MKKLIILLFCFASHIASAMLLSSASRVAALTCLSSRSMSSVRTEGSSEQFAELKRHFPVAVLQRYVKDHKKDLDKALVIRDEWIKYAMLARAGQKPLAMFSKDVDNMWHTFLLFNREYEDYCSRLGRGGEKKFMLYHIPDEEGAGCPNKCQWVEKQHFNHEYQKEFVLFPDKTIWTGLLPCKSACKPAVRVLSDQSEETDLRGLRAIMGVGGLAALAVGAYQFDPFYLLGGLFAAGVSGAMGGPSDPSQESGTSAHNKNDSSSSGCGSSAGCASAGSSCGGGGCSGGCGGGCGGGGCGGG